MASVTVACVWTGDKYPQEYVTKLRSMVERNLHVPHNFVCYTDHNALHMNHIRVDQYKLPGWWSKMCLFSTTMRMYPEDRLIYLDLDTIITGDITALARAGLKTGFGICRNFARLAGAKQWPCRYGSCVMIMDPWFGQELWLDFVADREKLMRDAGKYGDQIVIEWLLRGEPDYLQDVLPYKFLMDRRYIHEGRDPRASLVIFAGRDRPHNCEVEWVRKHWQ